MLMDKKSIDKDVANLCVEALMFWELPKVELALDNLCRKWLFNEIQCKAYKKIYLDLTRPESDAEDLVETVKMLQ